MLGDEPIDLSGVLCFVDADWPLLGGAFTTRSVEVLWPRKLYAALAAEGPLTPPEIVELHTALARALPRA